MSELSFKTPKYSTQKAVTKSHVRCQSIPQPKPLVPRFILVLFSHFFPILRNKSHITRLSKFAKGTELLYFSNRTWGTKGPVLRPRYIGPGRARTQIPFIHTSAHLRSLNIALFLALTSNYLLRYVHRNRVVCRYNKDNLKVMRSFTL